MPKVSWKMMGLLVVAALMLASGNLQAQGWYVFGGVGASSQFNVWGVSAAFGIDPVPANVHVWTGKSMGGITDGRTGVPLQKGNLWVIWNTTDNKTAFYLSVDSTVGVRAMYASPRTTLWLDSGIAAHVTDGLLGSNVACGGTSNGLGAGIAPENCTLPAAAIGAINGAQFTVGFSELRPEDAKLATERTCGYVGGCPGGIGAGTINSAISTANVRPIEFNISGTDPISGAAVPVYSTYPVGANSVLVFVNDQAGSQGVGGLGHRDGFGAPEVTDITRSQLTGFVDGSWSLTRDVSLDGTLPAVAATTFVREPLSGTYNTFEYQVPNVAGMKHSQEDGTWNAVRSSGSTLGGGVRNRVIGTGEMTGGTGVAGVPNSLGYAFWGFGNFASASAKTRYLTVDGVEPLQNANNYGYFPFSWNAVTHKALRRGDYPVWGLYYAITANPNDPFLVWMNLVADFVVGNYPEYADWTTLKVFKSHYNPDQVSGLAPIFPGMVPHNGIAAGAPGEWGGTVAGQTFGRQTEQDYYTNTAIPGPSKELVSRIR